MHEARSRILAAPEQFSARADSLARSSLPEQPTDAMLAPALAEAMEPTEHWVLAHASPSSLSSHCFVPAFCSHACAQHAGFAPLALAHAHIAPGTLYFPSALRTAFTGSPGACACPLVLQRQMRLQWAPCACYRAPKVSAGCVYLQAGTDADAAPLPSTDYIAQCVQAMLPSWQCGEKNLPQNVQGHDTLQALMLAPGFDNHQALQCPKNVPGRIARCVMNDKVNLSGVFSVGCGDGLLEELLTEHFGPLNVIGFDCWDLHPCVWNVLHAKRRPMRACDVPRVPPTHCLLFSFGVHKVPWTAYVKQQQVRAVCIICADSASNPSSEREGDRERLREFGFRVEHEGEILRAAGGNAKLSVWFRDRGSLEDAGSASVKQQNDQSGGKGRKHGRSKKRR